MNEQAEQIAKNLYQDPDLIKLMKKKRNLPMEMELDSTS